MQRALFPLSSRPRIGEYLTDRGESKEQVMIEDNELYCKIYVDADIGFREMVDEIKRAMNAQTDKWGAIYALLAAITVRRNEDFDEIHRDDPDGFVCYRYYLDVSAVTGQTPVGQIAVVSRLLQYLWVLGYRAVAACDFEEQLPKRGGYHPDVPRR